MNPENVLQIINSCNGENGSLISILEDIQSLYSYLPREALEIVAKETNKSLVDIYGVATFYKLFKLTPRGEHLLSVCLGTACHVRGAPSIAREVQKQLGVKSGQTTPDNKFTLETVNCLGACALGPVVVVDGHYYPHVNIAQVAEIIEGARNGLKKIEIGKDDRLFPVEVSCSRCNHSLMDPKYLIDELPSIKTTISYGRKHGWLRLSCLYGSYNVESEYEIPYNDVVHIFCPHCHTELIGSTDCPECGTKMVPMIIRKGGVVQICTKRGCKGHLLDLV